jgi:hypothetical protein
MSSKHKRAFFGTGAPKAGKTAVITPPEDGTNWMRACWRIQILQLVDPYGWHALTPADLSEMRTKLAQFEQKTWNEIFVDDKKHNHSVPVDQFDCPRAKQWMRKNLPREDELWTLYLGSTERVWGIRRDGAFHIIFWDPTHQIKLSPKRHT